MAGAQASSQAARAVHAALMAAHTALPLSLSHAHTSTPSPPPSYTLTQSTLHTSPIAPSQIFILNPHDTALKLTPIRSLTSTLFHSRLSTHTLLYTCLTHTHRQVFLPSSDCSEPSHTPHCARWALHQALGSRCARALLWAAGKTGRRTIVRPLFVLTPRC